MADCLICYERAHSGFQPEFRPNTCNCKYIIHPHCYNSWLESTGLAYNCMMCRAKVTHQEAALIRDQQIRNSAAVFKCVVYICICYFVTIYYREILLIALLSSMLKVDRHILRLLYRINNNF